MISKNWFARLERVHETRGRVRWRYRCRPEASYAAKDITLAASHLSGVVKARSNATACSLIVEFDARQTNVDALEAGLLALDAPLPSRSGKNVTRASDTGGVITRLLALLVTQGLPQTLKTPVTLAAAAPLLAHALADLRESGLTSHVLEALAVSISVARKDYLAANTTSFMLALGEHLEESIARRSEELLKHLAHPVSDEVWVEHDGKEILTPVAEVQVGDTVVAATGIVIPIDGTVLGGEATVNEASMTGESTPVVKIRGDAVLSGTLIEEGRIRIYAEHVGGMTAVARIADYVEQSLTAKSEAQLHASRLADRLVPVVLGLAGAAFVLTQDWVRVASVLQADYSCALKLATPVAFKSSMYSAGQNGILFKGAMAMERLAEADTFVFDKTGTLTTGLLEITDSIVLDRTFTPDDLICLAASVEEHYFHPLAIAVVSAARAANGRHFYHNEVEFVVAHGVASEIDGKRIIIGSRHFIEEDEGIDVSAAHEQRIKRLYRQGKTLLYIGYGRRLIGLLALKDTMRENSAEVIRRLRSLGVRSILMLTGDHRERAEELAETLGLDGFHAQLLPADKAAIIEKMKADGARIAFIGDGINDAPALSGAHVGIAMQKGSDIARMSADIALLEDDIARVADAKAIAKHAMKLIDTDYRLAVGLNTAILGAAALGALSPIAASTLHNGTTIGILLNALLEGRKV
ncbi:ATPase P [Betaproteobacteria bacterium]|nr:ATPase P [Betaproteobacteria bacterium]